MRHTFLTILLVGAFILSFGKGPSSFKGKITSSAGTPLSGASVLFQNKALSSARQQVKTGADGSFQIPHLDSGDYAATIVAEGYESQRLTSIHVGADAVKFLLNVQLQKAGAWGNSITTRRYVPEIEIPAPKPEPPMHSAGKADVAKYSRAEKGAGSSIKGVLKDERGNPIINANVVVTEGGILKGRDLTDFDGNYTIRPLGDGRYNVKFSYLGKELTITNVVVGADQIVTVNGKLVTTSEAVRGKGVEVHAVRSYAAPIIDPENPGGRTVKTAEMVEKAPTRNTSDIASMSTRTYSGSGAAMSSVGYSAPVKRAVGEVAMETDAVVLSAPAPETHGGMLTSGEINDFSKWTLWEDVSMETLKGYRAAWPFRPEARYTVLVKSRSGMPLCNAHVKMSDGSGQVWDAVTDNTGKAELWYGMWNSASPAPTAHLSANVEYGRDHFSIPALKPFAEGANILATNLSCLNPAKLDIAFIVDATGSMGDEISYLKAELRDILKKVQDSMPAIQVQTGALFYRDFDDIYLTRASGLTPDFDKTEAFIADNDAGGGGDMPEGVDAALEEGLNTFHWRSDATARLAFLVLDAPPHNDAATVKRMQELTAQYAALGIRLIPVVCSGSDKQTEYLMRSIALATNGTYLFLTDHSGIGGSHTAPTTDKYDVEYLNGLIYRVIYQCAYMPSCSEVTTSQTDTTSVQQKTDSVTISWRYFPNPTSGILHIEHTNTSGYLLVTDVTGKAIMRVPASPTGSTTIDLSQYPAGIYAIRYNWADDKWVSGKFVLLR